jgi:hypothetical protein
MNGGSGRKTGGYQATRLAMATSTVPVGKQTKVIQKHIHNDVFAANCDYRMGFFGHFYSYGKYRRIYFCYYRHCEWRELII